MRLVIEKDSSGVSAKVAHYDFYALAQDPDFVPHLPSEGKGTVGSWKGIPVKVTPPRTRK